MNGAVAVLAAFLAVALAAIAVLAVWLARARATAAEARAETAEAHQEIAEVRQEAAEREPVIRADAAKRSRTGHLAAIGEHFAPLMPDFPYNRKDVQWTGGPGGVMDYIVYDGLEDGRPVTIVLLDVKTGNGGLTASQRRIREAARDRRIEFDVYRMPALPVVAEAAGSEVPLALPGDPPGA